MGLKDFSLLLQEGMMADSLPLWWCLTGRQSPVGYNFQRPPPPTSGLLSPARLHLGNCVTNWRLHIQNTSWWETVEIQTAGQTIWLVMPVPEGQGASPGWMDAGCTDRPKVPQKRSGLRWLPKCPEGKGVKKKFLSIRVLSGY